jgi:hypothetical protein
MRFKQTQAAVTAAAAVVSLAAGCSTSQPVAGVESPAAAAAAAARYQVTGTLRTVYDRLYRARIGYGTSLDGSLQTCLGARSQLYYRGDMDLHPLGGKISGAAFTRRITRVLRRQGWWVDPQKFISVPPPGRVYSYQFIQGGSGGLMYVVAGQPGLAPWARFEVQGQCFKHPGWASPAHPDRLPLPHPGSHQ